MAKETKAFSKEELEAGCTELQEVMELDTLVAPGADEEALLRYFIDAGGEVLKDDKFSEETTSILKHFKEEIKVAKKAEEKNGIALLTQKSEPQGMPNIISAFNAATKLVDLKGMVTTYDEFKSLRKKLDDYKGLPGLKELRGKMEKMLGKAATEKPTASPAATAKKSTKQSRAAVFTQIVGGKKKKTKEEIVEEMLKIYGSSESEAKFTVGMYLTLLTTMGYAEKDDAGKISISPPNSN